MLLRVAWLHLTSWPALVLSLVLVYMTRSSHVNSMVSTSERPCKYGSEPGQVADKDVDLGCYFGHINSISTSELIAILSGFIYSKSLYKIEPKLYSQLAYMIPQSTPVKQYD